MVMACGADDAIHVNKKEDTLTYQELCELRQELELRLDEEQSNNNEREIRYKKELEKLRQELEMERKEVIRLEVQLDKASATKEVDVDNVRQQMTEKVEVLKQELKQVKESEKIAESRVRELVRTLTRTHAHAAHDTTRTTAHDTTRHGHEH